MKYIKRTLMAGAVASVVAFSSAGAASAAVVDCSTARPVPSYCIPAANTNNAAQAITMKASRLKQLKQVRVYGATDSPGTLFITYRAVLGGKKVTIATGKQTFTKAGSKVFIIKIPQKYLNQLKKGTKITVIKNFRPSNGPSFGDYTVETALL